MSCFNLRGFHASAPASTAGRICHSAPTSRGLTSSPGAQCVWQQAFSTETEQMWKIDDAGTLVISIN